MRSPSQEFIDYYEIFLAENACLLQIHGLLYGHRPASSNLTSYLADLHSLHTPWITFPEPLSSLRKILDPQPAHLWISPPTNMTQKMLQQ